MGIAFLETKCTYNAYIINKGHNYASFFPVYLLCSGIMCLQIFTRNFNTLMLLKRTQYFLGHIMDFGRCSSLVICGSFVYFARVYATDTADIARVILVKISTLSLSVRHLA